MKKGFFVQVLFLLVGGSLYSQLDTSSDYNFGFEDPPQENGIPAKSEKRKSC